MLSLIEMKTSKKPTFNFMTLWHCTSEGVNYLNVEEFCRFLRGSYGYICQRNVEYKRLHISQIKDHDK